MYILNVQDQAYMQGVIYNVQGKSRKTKTYAYSFFNMPPATMNPVAHSSNDQIVYIYSMTWSGTKMNVDHTIYVHVSYGVRMVNRSCAEWYRKE